MTALMLAEPEAAVRGFPTQQLTSDSFDVLAFEHPDELPRSAEPDVLVLGDRTRSSVAASATAPSSSSGTPTHPSACERSSTATTT